MTAYIMPKPADVVQNLRNMASDHKFAFAHSVVCRQAADEIERLKSELDVIRSDCKRATDAVLFNRARKRIIVRADAALKLNT